MDLHTPNFYTLPLGEESVPALLALYRQCEDFLALGPVAKASEAMVRADLALTKPDGGTYYGIFQPDGTLVGVLDVIPQGFEGQADQAFIELLMIGAPYRGKGLGEEIVQALMESLHGGPARKLLAGVQVNNPRALKFWQRMGFRVISEPKDYPDGTTAVTTLRELW
jgi:ribosomal protein S18 acetylase RimI-like enzyme